MHKCKWHTLRMSMELECHANIGIYFHGKGVAGRGSKLEMLGKISEVSVKGSDSLVFCSCCACPRNDGQHWSNPWRNRFLWARIAFCKHCKCWSAFQGVGQLKASIVMQTCFRFEICAESVSAALTRNFYGLGRWLGRAIKVERSNTFRGNSVVV